MTSLRADAARSRERILQVARGRDPRTLRLNEIAREAGVGVGTVYRHFSTTHALVEAVTEEALDRLAEIARTATDDPDPARAFSRMIHATVALHLEAGGLQAVLVATDGEGAETSRRKAAILADLTGVLTRAQRAGVVRADLTAAQVEYLVCGIEHAVRLGAPEDRGSFVEILLAGLRPGEPAAPPQR